MVFIIKAKQGYFDVFTISINRVTFEKFERRSSIGKNLEGKKKLDEVVVIEHLKYIYRPYFIVFAA